MDLLPTEEQQQIVDTAANFLANEFPVQQLIKLADNDTGFTREHLQQIADLGWIGIGLPDVYEGIGYGLSEEALLFVELGRNLIPPSLLGSVLGARVAAIAGDKERLGGILGGALKVALGTARATTPNQITLSGLESGQSSRATLCHQRPQTVLQENLAPRRHCIA